MSSSTALSLHQQLDWPAISQARVTRRELNPKLNKMLACITHIAVLRFRTTDTVCLNNSSNWNNFSTNSQHFSSLSTPSSASGFKYKKAYAEQLWGSKCFLNAVLHGVTWDWVQQKFIGSKFCRFQFWVPILVAKGPYLVPISWKIGPYQAVLAKKEFCFEDLRSQTLQREKRTLSSQNREI